MVTLSRQNSRLPSSDYELIFIIWLSFTDLTCCTCALEAWEAHLQGPTCCKIAILVLKTKSKNRVLFLKQLFLLKLTEKTTSRGERKGLTTHIFCFFLSVGEAKKQHGNSEHKPEQAHFQALSVRVLFTELSVYSPPVQPAAKPRPPKTGLTGLTCILYLPYPDWLEGEGESQNQNMYLLCLD